MIKAFIANCHLRTAVRGLCFFLAVCSASVVAKPAAAASNVEYQLGQLDNSGYNVGNGVVRRDDGTIFGLVAAGGRQGNGWLFKITPEGEYQNLHHFGAYPNDGRDAAGKPLLASDGKIYGVTTTGSIAWRYDPDNGNYRVLTALDGAPQPRAGLTEGSDGRLYGISRGTVFTLQKDGSDYQILASFSGGEGNFAPLVEGPDHRLYSTLPYGGDSNEVGSIIAVGLVGTGLDTLEYPLNNDGSQGCRPMGGVNLGPDGALYGTTAGASGKCSPSTTGGTIFRLAEFRDGQYRLLETFHVFSNDDPENLGLIPLDAPVLGADGAMYGTTRSNTSKAINQYDNPRGAFYRYTLDGLFTYRIFNGQDGTSDPGYGPLTLGSDGQIYGMTTGTQASIQMDANTSTTNAGTVYKYFQVGTASVGENGDGRLQVVHSFWGDNSDLPQFRYMHGQQYDGYGSRADLVAAPNGDLYGTTEFGGIFGNLAEFLMWALR